MPEAAVRERSLRALLPRLGAAPIQGSYQWQHPPEVGDGAVDTIRVLATVAAEQAIRRAC